MNEYAKKAARRAELEYVLLREWARFTKEQYGFEVFLQDETEYNHCHLRREAIELIALYGSEPTGEREG